MDELLSEKEQIEQMRVVVDYGFYVIGVVLGAAMLFGLNYYQNAERRAQEDASIQYDAVVVAIADGDLKHPGGRRGTGREFREQLLCRAVQTGNGETLYGQEPRPGCRRGRSRYW